MENQFSVKIKKFQSDGGIELIIHKCQDHLIQFEIHHQMSCPYTLS